MATYEASRFIATQRRLRHERSPRKEDIDDEQAGVVAEIRFAQRLTLDPTIIVTFDGAGGYDFRLPRGHTIDVKSSWQHAIATMSERTRKQFPQGRLMVEVGHVEAAAYVYGICHYIEATDSVDVEWVGWAWDWQVRKMKSAAIDTAGGKRMRSYRGNPPNKMEDFWAMADGPPVEPDSDFNLMTTVDLDGNEVLTKTANNGRMFEVVIGGQSICMGYLANGKWYDLYDRRGTPYDSKVKLRVAAMKRLRGDGAKSTTKGGSLHYHDKEAG